MTLEALLLHQSTTWTPKTQALAWSPLREGLDGYTRRSAARSCGTGPGGGRGWNWCGRGRRGRGDRRGKLARSKRPVRKREARWYGAGRARPAAGGDDAGRRPPGGASASPGAWSRPRGSSRLRGAPTGRGGVAMGGVATAH